MGFLKVTEYSSKRENCLLKQMDLLSLSYGARFPVYECGKDTCVHILYQPYQ